MPAEKRVGRARPQDVDRAVGARMRERRILLGLTQEQMARSIGVTYQQAHKYEKGFNWITSGGSMPLHKPSGWRSATSFRPQPALSRHPSSRCSLILPATT